MDTVSVLLWGNGCSELMWNHTFQLHLMRQKMGSGTHVAFIVLGSRNKVYFHLFPTLNNKQYTVFGTSMCPQVMSNLVFLFLRSFTVVTARKVTWECHSWNEIIKEKAACGIVMDTVTCIVIILNETMDFRSTRGW